MSFEFCNSDSGFLTFLLRSRIKCVRSGHLLTRHRATLRHSFEDLDQTPQLVGGQVLKCRLSNEPAAVSSKPIVLSATGLQTLQSSAQGGHGPLSAPVKLTVGTVGAGPGRSSHWHHAK
jgi:hypothetical protein